MELLVHQPSLFCFSLSNHICFLVGLSPAEVCGCQQELLQEELSYGRWASSDRGLSDNQGGVGAWGTMLSTLREHAQGWSTG